MYEEMDFGDEEIQYAMNEALLHGREKKVHGVEAYHEMKKS